MAARRRVLVTKMKDEPQQPASAEKGSGGHQVLRGIPTSDDGGDKPGEEERPVPACRVGLGCAAALLPVSAAIICFATVASCYLLTEKQSPFIEKGLMFPAISFLGTEGDAKTTYQVGFATTGTLLMLCIGLLTILVHPLFETAGIVTSDGHVSVEEARAAVRDALRTGLFSAVGVIVQGLFVLETKKITLQSFIHWGGALVFMTSAQNHATEVIKLYERTASKRLRRMFKWSLSWKQACLNAPSIMFLAPIGVQVCRAAFGLGTGAALQNAMGLMQWGIVAAFVMFYVSYGYDLWLIITTTWPKRGEKSQKAQPSQTIQ